MGSDQRIRGHRLLARFCYGACFGFGLVITTVTLSAMFWIVWCYFGLTSVSISDTQRRALVDYSFTIANQQITSSPTFPPDLPETSVNQISKVAAASINPDKMKELYNERIVNTTKNNFAGKEQINKTLDYIPATNKTVDFSKDDEISSKTSAAPNLEERYEFKEENRNRDPHVGMELQNNDNRQKFGSPSLNTEGEKKTDSKRSSNFDPNDMHIKSEKDSRRVYETSDLPIRGSLTDDYDNYRTDDGIPSKLDHSQNIHSQLSNIDGYKNKNVSNVTYYDSNIRQKHENSEYDDKFIKDDNYEDTTPLSDSLRNEKHDITVVSKTNESTIDDIRHSNRRHYTGNRNDQRAVRENIKPQVFEDDRYYETSSRDDRRRSEFTPSRRERFEGRPYEYDRDSGRFYETRIRDDGRRHQTVPPKEERFDRRPYEYDRDTDKYHYDNERKNNEPQVNTDRRFRYDRYADSITQDSRFSDEGIETDRHIYEGKQFEEEIFRNRRINEDEEKKYQNRRIIDDDENRRRYPEDKYGDKVQNDRDLYLKDDRYRNRNFRISDTNRRQNTDRYQPRNKEYYDEEGKFYERSYELPHHYDRERPHSTRYDERLIDDSRERRINRNPILSSRSDYISNPDITSPQREVYNIKYDSRSTSDRNFYRDYPQIGDRVSETRKPLIEDRYRSEYTNEKDEQASRYIDRDRISPTRVIDNPYISRPQYDVYDSRRKYQDNIRRETVPFLRDTMYDDERHRTLTRIGGSRNSDDEIKYNRRKPSQEERNISIGDGKEVTLDRRSYSSEDDEIRNTDRARPTFVRDRDYDYDNTRRRDSTGEARKDYPYEIGDYGQSRRANYGNSNYGNRDSYIRNNSREYDEISNRDTQYIGYVSKSPDKHNRDLDTTFVGDRDRYEGSKINDHYDNRKQDGHLDTDNSGRRINSGMTNRRQEEHSLSSYDQHDKQFQGNGNSSRLNNRATFPGLNAQQDNINRNPNTKADDITPKSRQEKNNEQENLGDGDRHINTNQSEFDSDQPLSAKDVIEAALRHIDTSDLSTREVFYPVFDPRISNLTSSDIIRPSERRGTTINSKKKKK